MSVLFRSIDRSYGKLDFIITVVKSNDGGKAVRRRVKSKGIFSRETRGRNLFEFSHVDLCEAAYATLIHFTYKTDRHRIIHGRRARLSAYAPAEHLFNLLEDKLGLLTKLKSGVCVESVPDAMFHASVVEESAPLFLRSVKSDRQEARQVRRDCPSCGRHNPAPPGSPPPVACRYCAAPFLARTK